MKMAYVTKSLLVAAFFFAANATCLCFGDESFGCFYITNSGRLSQNRSEIVSGGRSVVGSNEGSGDYTAFLMTNRSQLALKAGHTYAIGFSYRVLSAADKGFQVLFYSEKAGKRDLWLPDRRYNGRPGEGGTASLMVTLGSFDDYHVVWNIVGKGSVAIDDIDLREVVREVSLIRETFEESKIVQGLLPFELGDTLEIPLRGEPQLYIMRSEAVHDLDGDGVAEAILTFTTYGDQIPQPTVVLGTRPRLSDVTSRFFPGGAPRLRHSPFTYFCDLDGDGREDIVFAEAGLDHPPWTGARIHVGLATKAGSFRDVSGAIPQDLWEARSYAVAVGDIDSDGRPEILIPDQGRGEKTALLRWKGSAFTAQRDWIERSLWAGGTRLCTNNWLGLADLDGNSQGDLVIGGGWERPNLRILFGSDAGFTASNLLTLHDGPFGHTPWDEWESPQATSIQGADVNGVVLSDLDNDGLTDLFILHEQVFNYKPGAITDVREPMYEKLKTDGGDSYGDMALQVFMNKGGRVFADVSDESPATALERRYYNFHLPVDINGDGFPDVVAGYWAKPYGADPGMAWGTTFFLNDGTGAFQVIEGSSLLPSHESSPGGKRRELGVFLPTRVSDKGIDGVFVESISNYVAGSLIGRSGKTAVRMGTGPNLADSATLGYPGFSEFYYLRTHPDAAAAVRGGQFSSGLEHYRAIGLRRGYQAFAPNARIRGTAGEDRLVLSCRKEDCLVERNGQTVAIRDSSGRYGRLMLEGIERVAFSDGELAL